MSAETLDNSQLSTRLNPERRSYTQNSSRETYEQGSTCVPSFVSRLKISLSISNFSNACYMLLPFHPPTIIFADDQVICLEKQRMNYNARRHISLWTREAISKLGWTALPYPPYSPDLVPPDFHPFGALKDACADKDWYRQGTHALASRWNTAVAVDGAYV
jgi:hypothetical protein